MAIKGLEVLNYEWYDESYHIIEIILNKFNTYDRSVEEFVIACLDFPGWDYGKSNFEELITKIMSKYDTSLDKKANATVYFELAKFYLLL